MTQSSFRFIASTLLAPLATLALGVACSDAGGAASTSTSSTSSDACADAGLVHAAPPGPGAQVAPDGAGHVTFAVSRYFFGNTDRDGKADVNGWKQYGFDLDGKVSNGGFCPPGFSGLCQPRNNAAQRSFADGEDGIDNAFGQNTLPVLFGLTSDFATNANASLAHGGPTLLLDLENLGAGADEGPLLARLQEGASLGKPPAYDGTDAWPVRPELLADPTDIGSTMVQSSGSYVVGNTWVGRFQGDLPIEIAFLGHWLRLVVTNPVITMDIDPQRTSATHGTLAGVLATDPFLAMARDLAPHVFGAQLCGSATFESILNQLAQASDILADGTQDPAKPCSGISIGLGFEAKRVQLGVIAAPLAPLPPVCGDGGAADGG